jgi:hypothetical protein
MEPSKVRLYISPLLEKMKPMMGFLAVSVSTAPPAPKVAKATLPSTPAFQPLLERNLASDCSFMNSTTWLRAWAPSCKPMEAAAML